MLCCNSSFRSTKFPACLPRALQVPLPVILPHNTALEALLACQPAQCELCEEEVERELLVRHRVHECEKCQVPCKGTGERRPRRAP